MDEKVFLKISDEVIEISNYENTLNYLKKFFINNRETLNAFDFLKKMYS